MMDYADLGKEKFEDKDDEDICIDISFVIGKMNEGPSHYSDGADGPSAPCQEEEKAPDIDSIKEKLCEIISMLDCKPSAEPEPEKPKPSGGGFKEAANNVFQKGKPEDKPKEDEEEPESDENEMR